jgi:hypothetical protein
MQEELIRILRDMRNFMENQNRRLEKLESSVQANDKDNGSPSHETQENKHDKRLGDDEDHDEQASPSLLTQPTPGV